MESTKLSLRRQTCVVALLAFGIGAFSPQSAPAASSKGCNSDGFTLLGVSGEQDISVPAASLPPTFLVKGKYVEFTVDAATFGLYNWTLTGVANPLDITGGKRTVVFSSKLPDHRGLVLTSDLTIESSGESLVITRSGPGLTMTIQAKDCANGGVFQVEVERDDLTATVFTHTLGDGLFYYDNPNVRDRIVSFTTTIRTFAIGLAKTFPALAFCRTELRSSAMEPIPTVRLLSRRESTSETTFLTNSLGAIVRNLRPGSQPVALTTFRIRFIPVWSIIAVPFRNGAS